MVLPPKQPQKQPVKPVTPLPSAEEPRKSNVVLYLLLLLVVAAGAAVYYFKVLKKKKEPGGQVVSPTPTQSGSPKPTQPPKSNLSPALATMRPDPASLHSPGAKLEATGGGATDHAAATTAGKVDWLVADGSVVAVGEPVAKLDGWKGPEKKFLDREKSLRDKQDKMTRLQAKDPPDPKAIASQQKEIDRVAGELQAARDKYEPFLIKAPLAGPTKALIEEGDEVTAGQDVVQVGGGSPAVIATFELSEKDRFKVGETANLLVDGKLTSATVDGVDGDKVRVRIASAPLPPAGAMAQLLKSDADPNKGQVVIPAAALHGDYVLMAKDGKVVKVAVNGKVDGAEAVIESGVNAGDTVLLGDGKEGDPAP